MWSRCSILVDDYDHKPLDVESTSSMNAKNLWLSQITSKEGKNDSDDAGSATETASSDFPVAIYEVLMNHDTLFTWFS